MMKRTPLIVLVLVGLVIAAAAFVQPPHTIVLRDDGFHPRVMTVSVGQTITFVNERDRYFWPASDFHPTHALYPAFDSRKPRAPGESYSFTFTEAGTYPFHDHLAAFYFGIIQVRGEDGAIIDPCAEGAGLACWQQTLFIALAERGVSGAYEEVARLYAEDPSFASYCHYASHNIGLASYQFYAGDPEFIFSPSAIACGAGFYHGFMEGYIGATGDTAGAAVICDAIGEKIGVASPDARLQCYHGIGHGTAESAVATSGAFGTRDAFVAEALKECEAVAPGENERYRCASGVFNAIANYYLIGAYGLSAAKEDPLSLCAAQPERYKRSCYGNMNSFALAAHNNDFSAAAAYIGTITDAAYRSSSIRYLAALAAVDVMHADSFVPLQEMCRALPGAYQAPCIEGFAHGFLEHGPPAEAHERALAFCTDAHLTTGERATCASYVLSTIDGWYSAEEASRICRGVEEDLRGYCPAYLQ